MREYQFSRCSATKGGNYIVNHQPFNKKEHEENVPTETHGLIHEITSYLLGYWLTPQYKSFWKFHKGLASQRDEETIVCTM